MSISAFIYSDTKNDTFYSKYPFMHRDFITRKKKLCMSQWVETGFVRSFFFFFLISASSAYCIAALASPVCHMVVVVLSDEWRCITIDFDVFFIVECMHNDGPYHPKNFMEMEKLITEGAHNIRLSFSFWLYFFVLRVWAAVDPYISNEYSVISCRKWHRLPLKYTVALDAPFAHITSVFINCS